MSSSPFTSNTTPQDLQERQIHTSLAYLTLAATLLTLAGTFALILSQYKRASRSLSTRQGVHKRRLVFLFLGLAVCCLVVVTVLKYVDDGARGQVVDTLAGGGAGGFGEDGNGNVDAVGEMDPDGERIEVVSRLVSPNGFGWCWKV